MEPDELPDKSLRGPDGTVYRRTPQRVTRRVARDAVDAGAAVVTDIWPDGLRWFDGDDARNAWKAIQPALVTGRRPDPHDVQWVGHVWTSDDGRLLLRFDGQH
ncbi:hypothetical protein [Luteimicrobium sp. DT211]|uniref:hypothetical protein n=1 Tax=Luteimicrobium sp. DT211 TaxID=3393412 RepID=UPI003CF36145